MFILGSRPHSSFNVIFSNWLAPANIQHDDKLLSILIKLLKPGGKLILKDNNDITSNLKLNGFVNVNKNSVEVITAEKPNFEVSSSNHLVFLKLRNKN